MLRILFLTPRRITRWRGNCSTTLSNINVPKLVNLLERMGKMKDTNDGELGDQFPPENVEVDQARLENVEEA